MADSTPAAAAAPPKPSKKRTSKARKSSGTPVSQRMLKAVADCKDRKGLSYQGIIKCLKNQGYDVVKNRARCRIALRALLKRGELQQLRGNGCSGSFKIAKKQKEKRIRKPKPSKKVGAKRPKKVKQKTGGKPSPGKKPKRAGKKKPEKAKSLKKSKPAGKRTPVKRTKPVRKPAKKQTPKKSSAKKSSGRKK